MSDDTHNPGGGVDDESGAGEPIHELREFAEPASPNFLADLRRKIERRALTSHVLALSWEVPLLVLLEFIGMVFDLFRARSEDKGGAP